MLSKPHLGPTMLGQRLSWLVHCCGSESPFNHTLYLGTSVAYCACGPHAWFESASKCAASLPFLKWSRFSTCHMERYWVFRGHTGRETLSKKAGFFLTMVPHLSHIKTQTRVCDGPCVAKLARWAAAHVYISGKIKRKVGFFCVLHQSSSALLLQKPRSFNDSFRGCAVQCHVGTLGNY